MLYMEIQPSGRGGGKLRYAILLASFLLLLFLSTIPSCSAHEFSLGSKKNVYNPGDTLLVTAEIGNTEDRSVRFSVSSVLEDLNMQTPSMPVYRSVELKGGTKKTITLYEITVDESFYSGNYVVEASLIENGIEIYWDEVDFMLQGLPEEINVEMFLCKDPECSEESLVFIKGENVYLDYTSDQPEPVIDASLTFPDNSKEQLSFPFQMKAQSVGSYAIRFTASKEGYRTVDGVMYFAVLEAEPEPEEIGEPSPEQPPALNIVLILITVAIVVGVGAAFIILYLR